MLTNKQTLENILKSNNRALEKPNLKGNGFYVYKNLKVGDKDVNIVSFDSGNFSIQEARKTHYIELGEYLLTLSTHHDEPEIIDLKYTHLYLIKNGQEQSANNLSGKFYSGCVVVIDKKLLAICFADTYPQFLVVIEGALILLPCVIAEQIIRNFVLTEKQQKSIIKMFPEYHWQIENGIVINPENMDVPTTLQISDWKRRTRTKSLNIDPKISSYYSVLLRKEKKETANIKYIRSSDF